MILIVEPSPSLRGIVNLPGDKSISHRAALFAALAYGESQVDNLLFAGVTKAMLNAISKLGVNWSMSQNTLKVIGKGLDGFQPPDDHLDCGNSATTMRLLTGALAASGLPAILDGSNGLRSRPMTRIVEPLERMGVDITSKNGYAPLELKASPLPLRGINYTLQVASAQVKSCLLLAGLSASMQTQLSEPGPSRNHTERMLTSMGADIRSSQLKLSDHNQYQTTLNPRLPLVLSPLRMKIPGDISSAAFLLVAALITPGSELVLKGVGINPTRTGILDTLQDMGGDIRVVKKSSQAGEPVGDIFVRYSSLRGTRVKGERVVRMIDEFPALAVAAAYANGETQVSQAQELRYKESDRIGDLCLELGNLGVQVEEQNDGFRIQGGKTLAGGVVDVHKDHRLAMALALIGLASKKGVMVRNAEIIAESYPEFSNTMLSLGASIKWEEEDGP